MWDLARLCLNPARAGYWMPRFMAGHDHPEIEAVNHCRFIVVCNGT
jgi:hypothetical protein